MNRSNPSNTNNIMFWQAAKKLCRTSKSSLLYYTGIAKCLRQIEPKALSIERNGH